MATARYYSQSFIPLESNPDVFNQLIWQLGVSSSLAFHDVLSIDDSELLAIIPRPVHALVLVFPTPDDYEALRLETNSSNSPQTVPQGHAGDAGVVWFKQTIHNACGFYGILHAVANGKAREHIAHDSILYRLLQQCAHLPPDERSLVLDSSAELETVYARAAEQGDTAPPQSAKDVVYFHYVCFTRSLKNGRVYELDGDKPGPVEHEVSLDEREDMLSPEALQVVRKFIERGGGSLGFNLLALAEEQ